MRKLHRLLVAALLWTLAAAAPSQASPIVWTLDSVASSLSLAVPDQVVTIGTTTATVQFRNQTPATPPSVWTVGNTAKVGGTITTNYVEGSSIEFLSGDMFGLTSGNYRPNPAVFNTTSTNTANPNGQYTSTSQAAGVFGGRVRANVGLTVDAGFFNFTATTYDVVSSALAISGTNFAANTMTLGIDTATLAFDGLNIIFVGQPIPDSFGALAGIFGTNGAATGTVVAPDPIGDPLLRRLTIPVSLPLMLNLEGTMLNASASGTIVAYAYVPEPGTLLLLGGGLLALAVGRRGPRAH
jgi:PEP-CTERM motif